MNRGVWVLTFEVNEYDQCGEYFKAVFDNKPTPQQLEKHGVPHREVDHVLNGGGRRQTEYEWFTLKLEELE